MYEQRLVVFLDLLGFSDFVKESSYERVHDVLYSFGGIIKDYNKEMHYHANISDFIKPKNSEDFFTNSDNTIDIFSDCIILSYPLKKIESDFGWFLAMLLQNLVEAQFQCFKYYIPIRGGMTIGEFSNLNNIVFGKGLVDAVNLEKKASYPRIVLSEEIVSKIPKFNIRMFETLLSQEVNLHYLDYFKDASFKIKFYNSQSGNDDAAQDLLKSINAIKSTFEAGKIKHLNNTRVYKKYLWLETEYEKYF